MKRFALGMFVMVCLVVAESAQKKALADEPPAVVHVTGGGTGLFVEPSVTPTDEGLTTNFSVGAKIFADGSASGHFTCLIPRIVVIDGQYTEGSFDADTGIATLSGDAIIFFPTFDPILVEFTNTFQAGGPNDGVFTLSETSGFFPSYPTDVDTEVVVKGGIKIH
jgi:hypothetical protein